MFQGCLWKKLRTYTHVLGCQMVEKSSLFDTSKESPWKIVVTQKLKLKKFEKCSTLKVQKFAHSRFKYLLHQKNVLHKSFFQSRKLYRLMILFYQKIATTSHKNF